MTSRFRNRRQAEALQQALERYERLLATSHEPLEARSRVASDLPAGTSELFTLAAAMPDAAAPVPDAERAEWFAQHLATAQVVRPAPKRALIRRPRLAFPAMAAAAVAVFAALLVPAASSLPGDSLYGLKRTSEDAGVFVASGPAEARLRLELAGKRFEEVEKLVDRAKLQALGSSLGTGVHAAPQVKVDDPELAALIQSTLEAAHEQIAEAAEILIEYSNGDGDLDDLVKATQRGRRLVSQVAEQLPDIKPPVLTTGVGFAKIEAEAKAARMRSAPEPTLEPCDTPTPSPSPTPTPDPDATPTAEPEADDSAPSPTPTETPEPTPCLSPSPEPTPTVEPTEEPTPTATPTPEATEPPADEAGASAPPEPDGYGSSPGAESDGGAEDDAATAA